MKDKDNKIPPMLDNPLDRVVILHVGQKVKDKWFKDWGVGTCVKALKTRWYIDFADGETRCFDKDHLQFLEAI